MTDGEVCFLRTVRGTTTWLLVTVWHTGPRGTATTTTSSSATWEDTEGSGTQPTTAPADETVTGFTVTASDCTCVWRGTADGAYVARHLVPDGLGADDYLRRTRHALTSSSSSSSSSRDECGVTVAPDRAQATLWWRLPLCDDGDENRGSNNGNNSSSRDAGGADEGEWLLDDGGADAATAMCLSGSLVLERVPLPGCGGHEALLHVLDVLGARVAALETQRRTLQCTAAQREQECAHMGTVLAQLTAYKARLEHDMYARFCAVLNEKKRRIRELTAQLDGHSNRDSDDAAHSESTPTPPLDEDDLSDVVFAPDDTPAAAQVQQQPQQQQPQALDLLGLRQSSSDLSPAHVAHRRHRVDCQQAPPSSPARPRASTPQRKRSRRADHDTQLDADALFDNLD